MLTSFFHEASAVVMRSFASLFAIGALLVLSAGQANAACSLSGSVFQFKNFPVERDQLTAAEKEQLAEIGGRAMSEHCSVTVTAVAPQNADSEAFNIRFKQSYLAREALAWSIRSGRARVKAMEAFARMDVKARLGRYVTGTIYVSVK